jgi:hypothetical protein
MWGTSFNQLKSFKSKAKFSEKEKKYASISQQKILPESFYPVTCFVNFRLVNSKKKKKLNK